MINYPEPSAPNFHSNMSFLPHFRFPSVSRAPAVATGPSAPPLMLCLDLRVHGPPKPEGTRSRVHAAVGSEGEASRGNMPDESEGSWSSRVDAADEPEGEGTSSSRGNTPDESEDAWSSHVDTAEESEGEDSGSESEGAWNSHANSADKAESPATSRKKGSFNWDREKGGFSLEWANYAEFEKWRQTEELACSIEFSASSSRAGGIDWSRKQRFVCGRQETGGDRGYEKKHPERQPKIGIRKSGCSCHIVVKQYPHTPTVLGRYVREHDHEIGGDNIAYTRLSGATRERIRSMLTQKIDPREIVSLPKSNPFSRSSNTFAGTRDP